MEYLFTPWEHQDTEKFCLSLQDSSYIQWALVACQQVKKILKMLWAKKLQSLMKTKKNQLNKYEILKMPCLTSYYCKNGIRCFTRLPNWIQKRFCHSISCTCNQIQFILKNPIVKICSRTYVIKEAALLMWVHDHNEFPKLNGNFSNII